MRETGREMKNCCRAWVRRNKKGEEKDVADPTYGSDGASKSK